MILIRNATTRDLGTIVLFNEKMARETERKKLNHDKLEKGVSRVLASPEKGFYLVAEIDSEVVGQLLITTEWSDWRNCDFWWIQSVYVRPDSRRMGVYHQLYEKVIDLAKEKGDVCGIRLYVEKSNHSALKTYQSLVMTETHYIMMETQFAEND
ncbi:MAG: GNAT family N-acetyltransferase [Candidatus Marinimicrobia bacterium]|nr:GNAT family N-acetyltransferase [Candidatus Neomarinimicrobiota bacterium]